LVAETPSVLASKAVCPSTKFADAPLAVGRVLKPSTRFQYGSLR